MRIRVNLSAMLRVDWSGVVEVPDDMPETEIQELVQSVSDEIDGSDYNEDTDYWEEGPSYGERINDDEPAIFSFVDGKLTQK